MSRFLVNSLEELGWNTTLARQLARDGDELRVPVRVVEVHRDKLRVAGQQLDQTIALPRLSDCSADQLTPAVGDWLLLDQETLHFGRVLERQSLFRRRAPGTSPKTQLIAANVDTVFIVSSCNQDFNEARLERYLVLARDANVFPVVVLTKADLCDEPENFEHRAVQLLPSLIVESLNALDVESVRRLAPFCGIGQTVVLLGSSGVGKSTLVNTLTQSESTDTQPVREDDDKGRHTTTGRGFYRLRDGGWLIDTPGMREIQLTNVAAGIREVFEEIDALASKCRFGDCTHETEPGCAVLDAIERGTIDQARLARWRKLAAEEHRNSETLAERRARDKDFGKMVRSVMRDKRDKRPR
jgi:ribosome biogenesis GTPase